jgi:beta-1,4-mannosyl-glycoprotein beta-1,4-N-acetylglucosaminyltransferase
MIYDCFTFFNELDLLEIRLHELNDVVDRFVLLEGTVTFTNKKKKLYFEENKERFKKFINKITHVVVEDSPDVVGNPWIIEEYQFNALTRGLKNCRKNDIILFSCVDEIPNSSTKTLWNPKEREIIGLSQELYYYYLNCKVINHPWIGTRAVRYSHITERFTPYILRHNPIDKVIEDGGWHFSYIGGVEKIRQKIFSFSHQEFNNPDYNTPEKILLAIQNRTDLLKRGLRFKIVDFNNLPLYLQNNIQRYQELLILNQRKGLEITNISLKFKDKARGIVRNLIGILPKFT